MVVLGQYNSVLLSIKLYWVSKVLVLPVYIGKSGDLVRCYRCLTDKQTTEDGATQLLYSIQFKLSHAMMMILTLSIFIFTLRLGSW